MSDEDAKRFSIASEWASYERNVVPADAGKVQRRATRQAFYAGAGSMFYGLFSLFKGTEDPTPADLKRLEAIFAELEHYQNGLALDLERTESEPTHKAFALGKGSRVRARWMEALDSGLSGSSMKVAARERVLVGTIAHIRGDDPANPTTFRLWVTPDEGGDDVVIDPAWIVEVL